MSWHSISIKPSGGPPQKIWLENEWCKIDNVGPPYSLPNGGREFHILVGRENFTLRQMGGRWYIEGSGPDDKIY